jgi:class 3 adenylate cyclase/tetratricopeptide (TPR) repeat protein
MTKSLKVQIEKLQAAIRGLEAQRSALGEAIVEPALAALRQQLAALEEQATVQAIPVEERRLVTILFFDIVGSTGLAEKLDPEEWRQVVRRVHTALGGAVSAHHGEVAQYLGDGLLAFFGSREASEHDPENAVRAALDGQAAVADLLSGEKVQLRAGVHSGLVVVGELGDAIHKEFTASGDAVNLAARLQSAAPPGGTLISHDTYRYVRGVFDMTPRPPMTVKGKSEPVQTYLVRRAKPRPFRSVARGVAGIETRTIGREVEMRALQEAYLRAYEGHGVAWAQLVSEPGVGKSRLLDDLSAWIDLRDETTRLLRARAFPDDASQPFALVRRMWFDRFQIAEDAPLKQAEIKWVERFKDFSGLDDFEEPAHALGLLVGLPFKDSPYIGAMRSDPTQVKGRALVVSRELVQAVRQRDPVVVLLEDLQWADAASWEYLMEVFLDEADQQPNGLFILGAARPEWHPPQELTTLLATSTASQMAGEKWGALISLAPLDGQATRQLVQELLQRAADVPEQVSDLIVERSEGVPYFAEEIINWFIDRGILDTQPGGWRFRPERLKEEPLPVTLQHLLLARLSGLSPAERAALQRGAIFGRHFWTGGVEALGVSAGEETLGNLQPRGFVEEQPESAFQGDTEWSFHHNLLQEVTYESVLKRERATLHRVAASWLERQARQAGRLDEFAGLLGEHCQRAGELSAAADWYLLAARRAFNQGAPREAKSFYTQALELLPPVDRERRWQALLGREEALLVLGEDEPRKADITALLELARAIGDDNYLAEAYFRQAWFGMQTDYMSGLDQAAREALTAARRCGNESIEAKALVLSAVADLGREDRSAAVEHIEEALRRARGLGDESVLAFVLGRGAYCYSEMGDVAAWGRLQLEDIELNRRLGNRLQEAISLGNLGANYLSMALYKQARSLIEQARGLAEALGAHRALAYDLLNLGEIFQAMGDLRKARQLEEQALQEFTPTRDIRGKVSAIADLGTLLLAIGDAPGAAARFTEGRELALSQGMAPKACEATTGLAASALMQGQLDQARSCIYEAWAYLKEHGWLGMGNPMQVYRICAETFDALGEEEYLQEVLEIGYHEFMEVADKINVPEWRQSFLENNPDSRAFLEMWERRKTR